MASNKLHKKKKNTNDLTDNNDMKIRNLEYLYDPRVLEDGAKRVFEIDKQNMELLKTLYFILHTKGKTDCWRDKSTDDNIMKLQQTKKVKIAKENKKLYNKFRKKNRTSLKNKSKLSSSENVNTVSMNENAIKSSKMHQSSIIKSPKIQKYPRCYFELHVTEQVTRKLGKIIFELYNNIVPITCENFMKLCTGFDGLSYKNTPLHRIISGYLCQGGDVTKFNGSGGISIYGGDFKDENFKLKHTTPGVLSMWNSGKNSNNSKFNVIFKKLEILDGKNVVFGKIIEGLSIIYQIAAIGTKIGRPKKKVIITDCGLC